MCCSLHYAVLELETHSAQDGDSAQCRWDWVSQEFRHNYKQTQHVA